MADAETINRTTDIMALIGSNTTLKRVASTGKGEYEGPCPFCGGRNRFRVQPNHPDGGRWYCRGCGEGHWHSAIDYVMRRDNIDFLDALETLGGNGITPAPVKTKMVIAQAKEEKKHQEEPSWQDRAVDFVKMSKDLLWSDAGSKAFEYLHNQRGLTDETIFKWQLGFIPRDKNEEPTRWGFPREKTLRIARGILIPCFEDGYNEGKIKYLRIRQPGGKYIQVVGSTKWLYGGFTYHRGNIAYLLESNFDVMLADQIGASGVGYASIPAADKLDKMYRKYFATVLDLVVIPDHDEAGIEGARAKTASNNHWHIANFVPEGSDLTDYYLATGKDDMKVSIWLGEQANVIRDGSPHE